METIHYVETPEQERRRERLADERFERRMQATVWAVRKTVKWAVIGGAAAWVYTKLKDRQNEETEDGES